MSALTEAARRYRASETKQEAIDAEQGRIGDAEYELEEDLKREKKRLRAQIQSGSPRVKTEGVIMAIESQMMKLNTRSEYLTLEYESQRKVQRDLERVYGREALFAEYDRLYHGGK